MSNLQDIRKSKGLTQTELAESVQISVRTLQDYEQSRKDINRIAAITLYHMAEVLECDMEELLEL